MSNDELIYMSAVEQAARIRSGELSPVELVDAVLERIDALQPSINAFVTVCHDAARQAARAAEQAVQHSKAQGQPLGALHGVPYSVKDLTHTAGVRTTMGSVTHADFVPDDDAVPVARLKAAGAILIGKTTTPAFGHKPITEGKAFGSTLNPWHTERTSGGSSGGAGAAVAAGMGALALGTDGGGSVRIPAACCGIVGLKGTLGSIPHIHAPDLFGNHSYIGPMTRSVADAALLYSIISGPTAGDPWAKAPGHVPPPLPPDAVPAESLRGQRVAWMPKVGNPKVDQEVLEHTQGIATLLADWGAEMSEEAPNFAALEGPFNVIFMSGMQARLAHFLPKHRERMDESLLTSMERGAALSAVELQEAILARSALFRQVEALFTRYDFLVSPTLSRPAVPATQQLFEPIEIDGEPVGLTRGAWYPYTVPFNLTGHPAITIPAGLSSDGLPTAFQIVGPWYSEPRLLELAARIESARPWAQRQPSLG